MYSAYYLLKYSLNEILTWMLPKVPNESSVFKYADF